MAAADVLEEWETFVSSAPYNLERTYEINYNNEIADTSAAELVGLWQEFQDFLRASLDDGAGGFRKIETVFSDPDEVLDKFHSASSPELLTGGTVVSIGTRKIATQQNYGGLLHSNWIEYLYPTFFSRIAAISTQLANTPTSTDRREIKDWYHDFRQIVFEVVEELARDEPTGDEEFEWDAALVPHDLANRVLWVTFQDDLVQFVNPGALRSSSATSSYLMATQRYVSGLFHQSDSENEDEYIDRFVSAASAGGRQGIVTFKTFINLVFHPHSDMIGNQPNTFSQGYPDLFLYRNSDVNSGGRTCRLERKNCDHINCQCAKEGVPEVVVTAENVGENCYTQIADVVPISTRHLNKFKKPSVEFIKEQRDM